MATEILAPGVSPALSTPFTVDADNAPLGVGLFREDGNAGVDAGARFMLLRKDVDGVLNPTGIVMGQTGRNMLLAGPGVYVIRRAGPITHPTGVRIE